MFNYLRFLWSAPSKSRSQNNSPRVRKLGQELRIKAREGKMDLILQRGDEASQDESALLRDLPPEMVMHIMLFLSPKDLTSMARTCRRVAAITLTQTLWKNLAPAANDAEKRDILKYGWRALATTLLQKTCFFCNEQPSFVFFFDNTRRCAKCLDENATPVTQFIAQELSDIENGNTGTALAKFCLTIGRMGKLDAADAVLEQLLQKQVQVHGEISIPVATVLYYQAQVYRMRSNAIVFVDSTKIIIARKGRDALLKAIDIRQQCEDDAETVETADCLGLLGGFLTTAAHWTPEAEKKATLSQAKEHVERASRIYEKLQDDRGLAQVLKLLGGMHLTDGDEKKAIECIERSLLLAKRAFGDRDVNVADVMQYFGYLYWNLNRDDANYLNKSLEWHQKELGIREEALGKKHPITSRAREDVCIILRKLGRDQDAQAALAVV